MKTTPILISGMVSDLDAECIVHKMCNRRDDNSVYLAVDDDNVEKLLECESN